MAFNNKRSWRLRFIDIDKSFVVNETEDEVIGYFVVRAPKGNQRPIYFSKNNSEAIDALVGKPSADWPDIYEVKAFNTEYPCYVSAPAGNSVSYPSYFGGFYLTKDGIQKFYNVATKEELEKGTGNAFNVKVVPGKEDKFKKDFANKLTKIEVSGPTVPDYEPISGEPGYGFFSMKKTEKGTDYAISFTKNKKLAVEAIDYDTMREGLVSSAGTDRTYWGDEDGLWTFKGQTAILKNFGRDYNAEELAAADFNALADWIGFHGEEFEALVAEPKNLAKLLINGGVNINDEEYSIAFGIQNTFTFAVTIEDEVIAYWFQQSPTEEKTTCHITAIGYDKYYYEKLLNYAPYNKDEFKKTGHLVIDESVAALNSEEKEALAEAIEANEYLGFYDPDKADKGVKYIGKYTEDDDGTIYYAVTEDLNTRFISFQDALVGSRVPSIYHTFFRPDAGDKVTHVLTEEEEIELWGEIDGPVNYQADLTNLKAVPLNPNFNNITIEFTETVNNQPISGGIFTGSLDPNGTNTYGNPNYYPELIADDDTFVCVRVLRKFGDDAGDLDEHGFYQQKRIIDPYDIDKDGSSPTEKKFYIEGDRYTTLVMQSNKVMRKMGGIWNDNYKQIIIDGLTEATLGEYDDAWIFVECTGQEVFKPYIAKISKLQENAATISPKILEPNEKGIVTDAIANKLVVNDRVNEGANALYAGEFEVYDEVTKTKYWRQPIGSVALMIARILDKKFGGAAPAWTNEGNIGGQLTDVKAIRSRYQIDQDAEKTLDKKGVNPIVLAAEEGVMIVSQKTTRDPNMLSDWSWLSSALSFLRVRREIRDDVMRKQIMKPINSYYMQKRQEQVDAILAKRLSGDSPIWDSATCDIAGVNNAYTKAQRDFVIEVAITVTPMSETVTLRLVHNMIA